MNIEPYLIPAKPVYAEQEIKKSVFITQLAHTYGPDQAKDFVSQIRLDHPNARHHCWAMVSDRPDNAQCWGFSDDGEPSGTAGKPILAQLNGSNVGEITAVVTRYFGGIKLGTGGLVKAYGGGVQNALRLLQTIEKKITTHLYLRLDYPLLSLTETLIHQFEAKQVRADYSNLVEMEVEIDQRKVAEFTHTMINKSSAKIVISEI